MKKILLIGILFSLLCLPVSGMAVNDVPNVNVMDALNRITNWIFAILLVFAAIMIIVSAFMFVTAAGNTEQVSKARDFVLYALIGVAVAIAARGMVSLVQKIVGT